MPCCDDLPPLDLGTLYLGDVWDGIAWAITDPLTGEPVDLTGSVVVSQWRAIRTARTVADPDTPDLELSTEATPDPTITLEDGTEPLLDLTFDEFMSAREPGDPLPEVGYPYIISLQPVIPTMLEPTLQPDEYAWDVLLIPPDDEPRTIREGTITLRTRVTRVATP